MATSPGDTTGWVVLLSTGVVLLAASALALILAWLATRRRRMRQGAVHEGPGAGGNGPEKLPGISILVLVRDQAGQIEGFIRGLLRWVQSAPGLGRGTEIIIVDHGSRDDTPAILTRLERKYAVLHVVRLPADLSQGRTACDAGLFSCTYRTVLLLDLLGVSDTRPALRSLGRLLNRATAARGASQPDAE